MSTAEIKISRIVELLSKTDESNLTKVLNLLSHSTSVADSETFPTDVINGIKKGKKDISEGRFSSNSDIRNRYKAQFPNANI